jgi:hypothetical protein
VDKKPLLPAGNRYTARQKSGGANSLSPTRDDCSPRRELLSILDLDERVRKGQSGMRKRIYVGNLHWSTTESELQSIFGEYGGVDSAEVITDRVTGRSRGFGFVQMSNDEATNAAIDALNGRDIDGRELIMNSTVANMFTVNRV